MFIVTPRLPSERRGLAVSEMKEKITSQAAARVAN